MKEKQYRVSIEDGTYTLLLSYEDYSWETQDYIDVDIVLFENKSLAELYSFYMLYKDGVTMQTTV